MSASQGKAKCSACHRPADAELLTYGFPLCGPCSEKWNSEAPAKASAEWTRAWVAKMREPHAP